MQSYIFVCELLLTIFPSHPITISHVVPSLHYRYIVSIPMPFPLQVLFHPKPLFYDIYISHRSLISCASSHRLISQCQNRAVGLPKVITKLTTEVEISIRMRLEGNAAHVSFPKLPRIAELLLRVVALVEFVACYKCTHKCLLSRQRGLPE